MLIVFVSIALGGFLVLMVTLMFGGDHDVDMDADADLDHDFDSGHHWLSVKVLSAFATAFGASGSIARAYDISVPWSIAIGLVFGFIIAATADFIIVLFYRQQISSTFSIENLAGKLGTVKLTIQPGQFGEVAVYYRGNNITRRAKCQDAEESVEQGELVKLILADASGFIVKKHKE